MVTPGRRAWSQENEDISWLLPRAAEEGGIQDELHFELTETTVLFLGAVDVDLFDKSCRDSPATEGLDTCGAVEHDWLWLRQRRPTAHTAATTGRREDLLERQDVG